MFKVCLKTIVTCPYEGGFPGCNPSSCSYWTLKDPLQDNGNIHLLFPHKRDYMLTFTPLISASASCLLSACDPSAHNFSGQFRLSWIFMWTSHLESVGLVVGFIMKGSSVSSCCNGVLNQPTRLSLCGSKEGGRRGGGWTGGPCMEKSAGIKLNTFNGQNFLGKPSVLDAYVTFIVNMITSH